MGEFKKHDWLIILQILANMFRMFGFALAVPAFVALYFKEYNFALIFLLMGVVFASVFSIVKKFLKIEECGLKHAVISLALAWIMVSLVSAIPFLLGGMGFVDGFFEAFSGWTGSGLTMVQSPEILPFSLNFWRGFIQWVGGFGIVILALLLYEKPKTAKTLFLAEGRMEDFFVSALSVARLIVMIYAVYTLAGTVLMWLSGMSLFNSLIHSLTAISTGGFSSHSVGIGTYGLMPMVVTMFLMMGGGISFVSHYQLFKGKVGDFFRNSEIRLLFTLTLASFAFVAFEVFLTKAHTYFDSLFYTISAITGTGAVTTVPLRTFPAVTILVFTFLMICGASYGSTTGAVKLWRIIIVLKILRRQVLRVFLPEHAVVPIKVGNTYLNEEEALKIVSYIFFYLALLFLGAVVFMFFGYPMIESIFTVASAQGNVGLNIIPAATYFSMHPILKLQLMLHMLLGRVEIIPFLVLLRSFKFVKQT